MSSIAALSEYQWSFVPNFLLSLNEWTAHKS